jgi:hypothetical protein
MAFVLPALAAVGGGSAVAGGVAVAGLAVGAYSAIQQKNLGDDQKAELKAQAKTEGVAAQQREVERRRNLIRALASQNAAAGAAGIETSGSVEALARRDIRDSHNDLLSNSINTQARQRALRSQASNAARAGRTNAATSLLDSGRQFYGSATGRKI